MIVKEYWESMGYLDGFNKEEAEYALNFYEEIGLLMENSDMKSLLEKTGIAELWNSYLPQTNEEWFKVSLSEIGSDAVELKNICQFEDEVWHSLIYELVYDLLKSYKDLDITDLIEALEYVNTKPLLNEKPVEKLVDYRSLFEFVLRVLLEQCSAFYEINNELVEIV